MKSFAIKTDGKKLDIFQILDRLISINIDGIKNGGKGEGGAMNNESTHCIKRIQKPIIVGNVVTGKDFFDRERESAKLIELLQNGAHVLLLGQRRIGKSSLMLETANRMNDKVICLYVDIQHCDSSSEVIVKLGNVAQAYRTFFEVARDNVFEFFKNLKGSIEEIGYEEMFRIKLRESAAADWVEMGNHLLSWLSRSEKKIVIFFDELPIFINRIIRDSTNSIVPEKIKKSDLFLSWLRSSAIQYAGKIAFVVGGSIGIEPVLEQVGLSDRLNLFTSFHLLPWDAKTAIRFLDDRTLNSGIHFEVGAKERIIEMLGIAIPHFVQKFLQNIVWDCIDRDSETCSVKDVERIYQQNLLAVQGSIELATYVERLERTLGREKFSLARDLLSEAANIGRLAGSAALIIASRYYSGRQEQIETIRFLLKMFEHDGYLQQKDSDYVFSNHLLRDYWKKEFGFSFIPAK